LVFFINGYNTRLSKTATAESFEAYRGVYKSKAILIILETVLSLTTFLMSRKLLVTRKYVVYRISYWLSLIIAIIFLGLCFGLIFLPKGPLI
jgi:hypothetical protein